MYICKTAYIDDARTIVSINLSNMKRGGSAQIDRDNSVITTATARHVDYAFGLADEYYVTLKNVDCGVVVHAARGFIMPRLLWARTNLTS